MKALLITVSLCHTKMWLCQALELLPSHTKVDDVLIFLENVLEERAGRKRSCQVLRSLLYAEHLQVSRKFIEGIPIEAPIVDYWQC